MAAVTAQQVTAARAAGRAAALALESPDSNPHAVHTPAWRQPRTAAARAALAEQRRTAEILARAWRLGYQAGQADYASERGLSAPTD